MIKRSVWVCVIGLLMASCSSEYGYRYGPHPQDWQNAVYADYRMAGDTVDILVDTNGYRLQTISILKSDGTFVKPTGVDLPQFEDELTQGNGVMIHGPSLAQGPTVAHFKKSEIGSMPWDVHVAIQGLNPLTIKVGK
jgi:hypothetical protein